MNRIMEVSATTKEGTYVCMYMPVSVPKLVQFCLLSSRLEEVATGDVLYVK